MRHLYPGLYIENTDGSAARSTAFTVWDDQSAGVNVTSLLRGPDTTSAYVPTTTELGLALPLRGPDDDKDGPPLFLDTGIGIRFQLISTTGMLKMIQDLKNLAASVASLNANGGGSGSSSATINNGSVTTAKIADNAVTTDKIASGAVTLTDLASEVTGQFVANAGGVSSVLYRTKAQGLPTTVVNGQLVLIPA